jgi:Amt family ammonium transporter
MCKFYQRLFSPATLACIPLTTIIVMVWHTAVSAQNTEIITNLTSQTGVESVKELRGMLNTIWVLIAAVLVIFMNAGFAMLESGLCREKNTVNILAKNLIVFALATLAFWITGFSLMFGQGGGFIGSGGWFLSSQAPATYQLNPFPDGLPIPVFFLFEVAFAGTAATIVSGAVAERIKFIDFLIFSLLLVGVSYPITGHWAWSPNGWLKLMGFKDFAGSTVVHVVGGCAALIGAWILGPRIGKYSDGRINALPGHNMSTATLGCLILWIGWFGFNPGSELAVNAQVPYIAVTTNLAAATGGVAATITSWIKHDKPDLSMIINGILAGLVSITAGCNGVPYWGAVLIGAIAGILVVNAITFFDQIGIDDPVGALSVHLVNGIWGTLAVGLFNRETGLLFGFGFGQLFIQFMGFLAIAGFTLVFSFLVWTILKVTFGLRVSPEEEIVGLDIGEHAMEAYSGFVKEVDLIQPNNYQ